MRSTPTPRTFPVMRRGKCGRPRTGARRPSRPCTPPESLAAWSPVPTPGIYEIRCHGEIDARWTDWFDGLSVRHPGDDTTVITGFFEDQAALHGVFGRFRDPGIALISLFRLDDPSTTNTGDPA